MAIRVRVCCQGQDGFYTVSGNVAPLWARAVGQTVMARLYHVGISDGANEAVMMTTMTMAVMSEGMLLRL